MINFENLDKCIFPGDVTREKRPEAKIVHFYGLGEQAEVIETGFVYV